MKLGSYLVG